MDLLCMRAYFICKYVVYLQLHLRHRNHIIKDKLCWCGHKTARFYLRLAGGNVGSTPG